MSYFDEPESPEQRFVDCAECKGTGKFYFVMEGETQCDPCEDCNGTGQLEVTDEDMLSDEADLKHDDI